MTKKIFITGSTGFIGRNLAEQLCPYYSLVTPSSKELNLLDAELVKNFLQQHHFDVVIHCATHDASRNSKKDSHFVLSNNLRMFFHLVRCRHLYGRMFYFGSGAEYDMKHYIPHMKEDYFDTYVPQNAYGFSKYIMAQYATTIDNIIDLRIFGCFGAYEDWEIRFPSNAICKALHNLDIIIRQNVYFDYLYIHDLVRIMRLLIEKSTLQYRHYNLCTGQSIDLLTLAQKIIALSGKKLGIRVATHELKLEYTADNSRLIHEIGEFHFTPIEQALKELYDWYAQRLSEIDKNLLFVDK